jgi:hypothetical protein
VPNRNRRHTAILVILFILAGSALSARSWDIQVEQKLAPSQFSETDKQQIRQVFEQAEQQQLPVEMLVLRFEEGLAKRVQVQTLQEALNRELQAYQETKLIAAQALGPQVSQQLLADSTIRSKIVTLFQQGVPQPDLIVLLEIYNRQSSKDKWNNFKYGGGLLMALRQWGLNNEHSLSIVKALSLSSIPGADYRAVLEILNTGISKRISSGDLVQRIVESAPKSRSITMLERLVR